jgi:hypothetical protein
VLFVAVLVRSADQRIFVGAAEDLTAEGTFYRQSHTVTFATFEAASCEIRAEEDDAALSRLLHHQEAQETLLLEIANKNGIDTTQIEQDVAELAKPSR